MANANGAEYLASHGIPSASMLFLCRQGDSLDDERGADVFCTDLCSYSVYAHDSFLHAIETLLKRGNEFRECMSSCVHLRNRMLRPIGARYCSTKASLIVMLIPETVRESWRQSVNMVDHP